MEAFESPFPGDGSQNGPRDRSRLWIPLPANSQDDGGVGIAVLAGQSRERTIACVEAVRKHTAAPHYLIIADDGADGGTAAWARESGIPVVSGADWGGPRNANRALSLLMRCTWCQHFILISDDARPAETAWEDAWIDAAMTYPMVSFASREALERYRFRGSGVPGDPYLVSAHSGQVVCVRREIVDEYGFVEPRLDRWSDWHAEWAFRAYSSYRKEGIELWVALNSGVIAVDRGRFRNAHYWKWSRPIRRASEMDGPYRDPFIDPPAPRLISRSEHEHEIARAFWPLKPSSGTRNLISVIVQTASRRRAERLYESIGPGIDREFICIWTGDRPPGDLPGTTVVLPRPAFGYEQSINHGALHAAGEILWIVADDVAITSKDAVRQILDLFEADERLGAVCAEGGLVCESESRTFRIDPRSPALNPGCWAIRRVAFEQMGGLEETLPGPGSDTLVTAVRLARLGYTSGIALGLTCVQEFPPIPMEDFVSEHYVQAGPALGLSFPPDATWTDFEAALSDIGT